MKLSEVKKRFAAIASNILTGSDQRVKEVAFKALQIVVLGTPVDTGHARANWQVGINRPVTRMIPAEDMGGGATITLGKRTILTRKPGQAVYLSNNVPYIQRLNEGWSAQAPAGFVEDAVTLAVRSTPGAKLIK